MEDLSRKSSLRSSGISEEKLKENGKEDMPGWRVSRDLDCQDLQGTWYMDENDPLPDRRTHMKYQGAKRDKTSPAPADKS